jgi:phosphotransferase system HPr (HPr) family protein
MAKMEITVQHEVGLHARPAASFVKMASGYPCDITVTNLTAKSEPANAKSILGVLSIGVQQGHRIEVEAQGDQAEDALTQLSHLIDSNFGE